MLTAITLEEVPSSEPGLRETLVAAHLRVDDIEDDGRTFYRAISHDGYIVGYAGIEDCGTGALLRSVVVRDQHRGRGFGETIVQAVLRDFASGRDIYLATTTAAPFFTKLGFIGVSRDTVPPAVLATRQLSSICPSSATIMKLDRPPI